MKSRNTIEKDLNAIRIALYEKTKDRIFYRGIQNKLIWLLSGRFPNAPNALN